MLTVLRIALVNKSKVEKHEFDGMEAYSNEITFHRTCSHVHATWLLGNEVVAILQLCNLFNNSTSVAAQTNSYKVKPKSKHGHTRHHHQ